MTHTDFTAADFYQKMVEFTGAGDADSKGRFADWLVEHVRNVKEATVRDHISQTEDHPWQEYDQDSYEYGELDDELEGFFFQAGELWVTFDRDRYYNMSRPTAVLMVKTGQQAVVGETIHSDEHTPAGFYITPAGILFQKTGKDVWTRLNHPDETAHGLTSVIYPLIPGPTITLL